MRSASAGCSLERDASPTRTRITTPARRGSASIRVRASRTPIVECTARTTCMWRGLCLSDGGFRESHSHDRGPCHSPCGSSRGEAVAAPFRSTAQRFRRRRRAISHRTPATPQRQEDLRGWEETVRKYSQSLPKLKSPTRAWSSALWKSLVSWRSKNIGFSAFTGTTDGAQRGALSSSTNAASSVLA